MKMVKSLLLGSAAGFAAFTGAQAADLPMAEPVEYVKICDTYGKGFFYIPGTDTCLKIGGFVRFDQRVDFGDEGEDFARRFRRHPVQRRLLDPRSRFDPPRRSHRDRMGHPAFVHRDAHGPRNACG